MKLIDLSDDFENNISSLDFAIVNLEGKSFHRYIQYDLTWKMDEKLYNFAIIHIQPLIFGFVWKFLHEIY